MSKTSQPTAPTVGFVSLGCPKNLVDSEVMMGLLDRGGARLTSRPEDAEILVVNTCSFIDTAKQESVDTILEMARFKTSGSAKKLIVAGCLVERYRDEIRKSIPEVDAVVGTGELESILEAAGIAQPATPPSPFNILRRDAPIAQVHPGQESLSGSHKASGHVSIRNHFESEQEASGHASVRNHFESEQEASGHASVRNHFGSEQEASGHDSVRNHFGSEQEASGHDSVRNHFGSEHEASGHDFSRAEKAPNTEGALAPAPAFRPEGDHRERQGRFSRDDWQGAAHLLPTYLYNENTPRYISTGRTSAYIKIAEGCDHPCTFCVIPNLRGKFRSRRFESVVSEARQLVASGVQEITLIGQDTTCYGEDLGIKDGLALLLESLAAIEGLRWLRFLYAYPNRITGKLLDTIARHDNICKYLDVPLQHASPDVLKRMKRGAGADIFLKTLEKVRAAVPGIALRTSFIVGFPGESLRDFEILEEFIDNGKFDWLGVFNYSHEEGSQAYALDAQVPKRTIESRKRKLMKLQQKISKRAKQQWVGRELVVLAEGASSETDLLWEARTEYHAPEIDGKVYINDFGDLQELEAGKFYRAEITEAHDYDLVARITSGPLGPGQN